MQIWVDAMVERRRGLTEAAARPAVHAVLGLINSTPFSPRTTPTKMVSLLRAMATAAIDAIDS